MSKKGFTDQELETVNYMHDAIINFLKRSGVPYTLNACALMLADATFCATASMTDEEIVAEFKKCLKQAQMIRAEREKDAGATCQ